MFQRHDQPVTIDPERLQQRPLDSHYPFVWLDAIHYKVKQDGRYAAKAVYTVLANLEGSEGNSWPEETPPSSLLPSVR